MRGEWIPSFHLINVIYLNVIIRKIYNSKKYIKIVYNKICTERCTNMTAPEQQWYDVACFLGYSYIIDFGLVEMAISTNPKPTI